MTTKKADRFVIKVTILEDGAVRWITKIGTITERRDEAGRHTRDMAERIKLDVCEALANGAAVSSWRFEIEEDE